MKTFKEYLSEAKYYRDEEDWQGDVNEYGVQVGVCPHCKGEAQITSTGKTLSTAKMFWECSECGHTGRPTTY